MLWFKLSTVVKFCLWGKSSQEGTAWADWEGAAQMVLRNSDLGLESQRQGCAPVEAGDSSGNNSIIRVLISLRQILDSVAWLR